MLLKLYPKVHRRYTSLPVLGPILNGFGTWPRPALRCGARTRRSSHGSKRS